MFPFNCGAHSDATLDTDANEQITPAELPQLCFNFLFLVIRPLVSANNFVTDCGPLVSK